MNGYWGVGYLAELEAAHAFLTPPLPEDYVPHTPEEQATLQVCTICLGRHGYVFAPDGGFDRCPDCQGEPVRWIVPSPPHHD